jgi:hypothetical protein
MAATAVFTPVGMSAAGATPGVNPRVAAERNAVEVMN